MKKPLIALAVIATTWATYTLYSRQQARAFIEAMRQQHAGYRLEHFPDRKLVFLHAPDGSRDGAPLDRRCIEEIVLTKTPAEDTTFGKDLYSWQVRYAMTITPHLPGQWMRRTFTVPYFAVEPADVVAVLRRELPEVDADATLALGRRLERDDCDTCTVWTHPQFDRARDEPLESMRCTVAD